MISVVEVQPANPRELVIARRIEAPAAALFRCWTDPKLLPLWFAPKPLTTEVLEMDLRTGGVQRMVMREPNGTEHPTAGVYLEITPNRRLVFTDAFGADWVPAENPMFTGHLTFEEQADGSTLYTARARHWTEESAKAHAEMGFTEGWGICATQMAEVARSL